MIVEHDPWWKDGVIYQIYPRSFYDHSGDGVGDLVGIEEKLDYLAWLGIDAIWLSPIYPSPDIDFGYDVSDHLSVDPRMGSLADFDRLVASAHRHGIRIILDLVLNHTSDQHPWFQQSRRSLDNPFRDWYIWRGPGPGGSRPNNWQSIFGGPGWEYDILTGQYYFHMFYKEQPDLNWRNPRVYNAMLDIFRFWCDRGVDGFRLDVFNAFFKHAELPSNPPRLGIRGFDRQAHLYDVDQPELLPLLQDIRRLLNEYPDRYAVGETFLDSSGRSEKYCGENLLHAAFNFNLAKAPWQARRIQAAVLGWEQSLASNAWPTQVLNNHDLPRSASRFGLGEDDERLKVAAGLLLTLRGTPYLYYGEEIGMRDISLRRSEIHDPLGRRYWPIYKGRDGCRAPMQWDAGLFAGFSRTAPWLPVHRDYRERNVRQQQEEPASLLHFYRQLLALRRNHSALRSGDFTLIDAGSRHTLVYLRKNEGEKVLIACNFSPRQVRLHLAGPTSAVSWVVLLSNQRAAGPALQPDGLWLLPDEILILGQPPLHDLPGSGG